MPRPRVVEAQHGVGPEPHHRVARAAGLGQEVVGVQRARPRSSGVTKPGPAGDSSTVQQAPPSSSSATIVTALEADTSAPATSSSAWTASSASSSTRRQMTCTGTPIGGPSMAVSEDVQQHADAVATTSPPCRRCRPRSSSRPGGRRGGRSSSASSIRPPPRASPRSGCRSARRPRSRCPDRRSSSTRRGLGQPKQLGAGVQCRDQLHVDARSGSDALDLVAQLRRPAGDDSPSPGRPGRARRPGRGRRSPANSRLVDVAHLVDPLGLGASQAGAAVAGRRPRSSGGAVSPSGGSISLPAMARSSTLIGVDIGGTFTDVALVHAGRLTTAKVSTTPADRAQRHESRGSALALERAGLDPRGRDPPGPRHDGRHQRPARASAAPAPAWSPPPGSSDVLVLARQARPHLYRPCVATPPPLADVTAERRRAAVRRAACCASLDRESRRSAPPAGCAGPASRRWRSACCTATPTPATSAEAARILRELLPGVFVVASHEIAAEYREYERASTTCRSTPIWGPSPARYLRRARRRDWHERGLPEPLLMQSSGGLCALGRGGRRIRPGCCCPARRAASPRSSPAAPDDAVAFDMGGTSCDVSLIRDGRRRAIDRAGRSPACRCGCRCSTSTPSGAGGGSVAWVDAGGALRVGPASAGADPGPACYGRGGTLPTVTDANLVLGRLDPMSRWRADCARPAPPPSGRSRPWPEASTTCARRPRGSSQWPTRRWCVRSAWSASSRDTTRGRSSWSRSAGPGRCTPAGSPKRWASAGSPCLPPAACSRRSASRPATGAATPCRV